MFKKSFMAIAMAVIVTCAYATPAKAMQNTTAQVALGGVVSGLCLSQVWGKMEAKQFPMYVKVPVMAAMAVLAYGIRTTVVPAATRKEDALGLLGALGSFWVTV